MIMPIGSVGNTYEATTKLLQHMSDRVYEDHALESDQRSDPLPPLQEAWTTSMYRFILCRVVNH